MQSKTIQPTSLSKFAVYLQQQDRSLKTIQGYVSDLQSFARWFQQSNGEKLTAKNLTPTDARAYRQWLVGAIWR